MSNVWFTSDLHIGHRKAAASRIMFQGMPAFDNLDELPAWFGQGDINRHDDILAENWDAVVGEDDIVWVLGDISSGTAAAQMRALDWIRRRPGRKHLITGNHDGPHPMHRDSTKWLPIYLDGVFETVQSAARRRIPLTEGHRTALLSHFPYRGDRDPVDRHQQWRLKDMGEYLLHGHTHSVSKWKSWEPRQIHVGVDAWGGRPVNLKDIAALIEKVEA
jgi:calcineurin-like phosphoesterase family protein